MITFNPRRLARKAVHFGIDRIARAFGSWNGLLVLTYHRIGEPKQCEYDRSVYSASTAIFAEQMQYLKKHFEVCSIDDVLAREPESFSGQQAVLVTFDDGYIDNYVHAFPILRDLGIPALFFVSTGFVDNRTISWWDEIAWLRRRSSVHRLEHDLAKQIERDLESYYRLPGEQCEKFLDAIASDSGSERFASRPFDQWITWDMAREMSLSGMSFGGHTVTHPILTKSTANWEFELTEGKRRIENEIGKAVDVFSYPVGTTHSLNESLKQVVSKHYRMAFSCYGGVNSARRIEGWNPFEMRRWPVWGSMKQFRTTITWPQLVV